jgi:hypothetical protein
MTFLSFRECGVLALPDDIANDCARALGGGCLLWSADDQFVAGHGEMAQLVAEPRGGPGIIDGGDETSGTLEPDYSGVSKEVVEEGYAISVVLRHFAVVWTEEEHNSA